MLTHMSSDHPDGPLGQHTPAQVRYLARSTGWGDLLPELTTRMPAAALPTLDDAWAYACYHHGPQVRPDGRPFATHLAETVEFLLAGSPFPDPTAIVVALLHDLVEDTPVSLASIRQRYGLTVATAVANLTIAPATPGTPREAVRAAAFRRLRAAPAWVRQIKLSDRLSTVQRIDCHPQLAKQVQRYHETLTYVVPLAAPFPWYAAQFALWRDVFRHLERAQP